MFAVRLLLVAAILFCHCASCAKNKPRRGQTHDVNRHLEPTPQIGRRPSVFTRLQQSRRESVFKRRQPSRRASVFTRLQYITGNWRIWKYDCENPKDWLNCIKETETVFRNRPNLFGALQTSKDIIWPADMDEQIKENRHKQVGTAIFRDGIVPDYRDRSLKKPNGGYFTLTVKTKVGEEYHKEMNQLGQLFMSLLKFFFGIHNHPRFGPKPEVLAAVCGIFARAEVNKDVANYGDNSDEFPAKFRFQVWLRDWGKKDMVANDLTRWLAKSAKGFGFEELEFGKTSDPKV